MSTRDRALRGMRARKPSREQMDSEKQALLISTLGKAAPLVGAGLGGLAGTYLMPGLGTMGGAAVGGAAGGVAGAMLEGQSQQMTYEDEREEDEETRRRDRLMQIYSMR